jgi:hypothetical protein
MPSDLKAQLNEILKIEKKLAFLPPGEVAREGLARDRDAGLRCMVSTYTFPAGGSPTEEGAKLLGTALLFLREAQEEGGRILPPAPRKELCQAMKRHEQAVLAAYRVQALELWRDVLDSVEKDDELKHKARRFCLDRVIKKLRALEDGVTSEEPFGNEVKLELGRALFLRAKIIRRKGFTVPLKKREKLTEALRVLDSTLSPPPGGKRADLYRRLRAWIHYELARLDDDGDWFRAMTDEGWEALREAAGQINLNAHQEDVVLLLAIAEKEPGSWKSRLKPLLTMPEINPLDQAWAAWRLGKEAEAVNFAKKATLRMPAAFSHEAWERLVRLIRKMAKKTPEGSGWRAVALHAWRSCSKRERGTNHLHLRWYWSRQRELYDFAFRAARKSKTKARVADSLKSRPALTLSQLADRINTDAELERFYEQEALGYLDQYIPKFTADRPKTPKRIRWHDLPAPWIAVHFYLEGRKGEKDDSPTGHAIIYNSKKSGQDAWTEETFKQTPLWQKFWAWQEAYRLHRDKADKDAKALEKCARPLESLCLALGEQMRFLFDEDLFPPEQPVLFVPHDFLHRLPIHMAMRDEKNGERMVWASTHRAAYLPAAWIWQERRQEGRDCTLATGLPIALVTLAKSDQARTALTEQVLKLVKSQSGQVHDPAAAKHLLDITTPPSALAILSHGKAHSNNPLASSLTDSHGNTWMTGQNILAGRMSLAGSKVALAACEADLVPPLSSTVDEHLSVSTALLQMDALEILGNLWRVGAGQADDLTLKMLEAMDKPLLNVLAEWQTEQIEEYSETGDNRSEAFETLYRCAPFRVLGVSPVSAGEAADVG